MEKIAIFGVPRSGTSWLSQIFNSHPHVAMRFQPLFSYEHKGKLTDHSTIDEINLFYNEIVQSQNAFVLMNSDIHKNYPVFVKSRRPTHIAFKETRYLHVIENMIDKCSDIKVVGIVRNPLAIISSWIQAPKEFNPEWDIHQEWRTAPTKNLNKEEEFYGFDKWKLSVENFIRFENMYPNQFHLVRYDQLKMMPMEITNELFKFCNVNTHPQVKEFITASQSSHDDDPYSVFRCKSNGDRWRKVIPTDIVQKIRKELNGTILQKFIKGDE